MQAEFDIRVNTGEHAITAYVDLPEQEDDAILEWAGDQNTALMDILLLLSIFTGREVFAGDRVNKDENEKTGALPGPIIRDSRMYYFGGVLRTSVPYKTNKELTIGEDFPYDIGFEEEMNRIYLLIRSEEWQKKYHHGYFLFLARQAFQQQVLESSFVQCWTIWEHLFAILDHRQSAAKTISFLLAKYVLKENIDEKSQKRIGDWAKIRNSLVHFGHFPKEDKVYDDAYLFIELTEFILAKILGLYPSDVFNTAEKLETFLKEKKRTENDKQS
jgi:hypothetical protein